MDTGNPVVRLCMKGIKAEGEGRVGAARALYAEAWAARRDDFDACVAAHYLARQGETPAETLRWNREALTHADAVGDERVRGFYPSLHLCLAQSHEAAGERDAARRHYALASGCVGDLPPGPYRELIQRGIADGQRRIVGGA